MIKTKVSCLVALAGLAVAIGCSSQADSPSPTATAAAAPAKSAVTADMLAKGAATYKANCAACHGDGGKGDGPGAGVLKPPPRDHTDPVYMNTLTDKNLADVIVMGGAMKGKPLMPSHPQLRGAELDGLVAHVRSLSAAK
jgi:mono/diheme cytochrome c family protein